MTVKETRFRPLPGSFDGYNPLTDPGNSLPRLLARPLFWTVCLAAAAGAVRTVASLPRDAVAEPGPPGWVTRYGELEGALDGEERALFVADDPQGTPKYKLFRAQYVLGPTVLQDRPSLARVRPRHLLEAPLVLDGSSGEAFEASLASLRRRAAEEGLELEVRRYPARLAVVRARAGGR